MSPHLVLELDVGGAVRVVDVAAGATVLGREPGVAVHVESKGISRRHAQLFRLGEALFIDDLGSKNGTQKNGVRITARERLHEGDVLVFSPEVFAVVRRASDADRGARGDHGVRVVVEGLGALPELIAVRTPFRLLFVLDDAASTTASAALRVSRRGVDGAGDVVLFVDGKAPRVVGADDVVVVRGGVQLRLLPTSGVGSDARTVRGDRGFIVLLPDDAPVER